MKKPVTPLSHIKHMLRQGWLRSRERREALRLAGYTCAGCSKKQSKAKGKEFAVTVHHIDRIDWDGICKLIRDRIYQTPDRLEVLCKECHEKEHHAEESVAPQLRAQGSNVKPGARKAVQPGLGI